MAVGYLLTCDFEDDEENLYYSFNPELVNFTSPEIYVNSIVDVLSRVAIEDRSKLKVTAYIDGLKHEDDSNYTIEEFIDAIWARIDDFRAFTGPELGILQDTDDGDMFDRIVEENIEARLIVVVDRDQILAKFGGYVAQGPFYARTNLFSAGSPLEWDLHSSIFVDESSSEGSNSSEVDERLSTIPVTDETESIASTTPFSTKSSTVADSDEPENTQFTQS